MTSLREARDHRRPSDAVLGRLPLLDRFLPAWIVAAMVCGIGLGRLVPDLDSWMSKVKLAGTSLPIAAGKLVLDAGCGSGRFATRVAPDATPVGVDIDPDVLRIAQPRVARCARASVDALPLPDGTFDLALAVTVLEFVPDPIAALAEIARVTRNGGRIVVGALNPVSPWGVANRGRLQSGIWCDAQFLTRADLRTLGSRHGAVELRAALYTPGAIPALGLLGRLLEAIGRAVPGWGAFQVLTITKEANT